MVSPRLEHLRDKLLQRGGLLSVVPPPPTSKLTKPELAELARRVRPFAEAMYLVISVDAEITERERHALRGALRILTDGMLSSAQMDPMLRDFEQARAREGIGLRLDAVASALYGDRVDAELALNLAIAAGEVDRGLGDREQSVVYDLAERLGITRGQVEALLDPTPGST